MERTVQILDRVVDLVYSPDDEGWYFQRFPDHVVSVTYSNETAARSAWAQDATEWDEDAS